MFCSGLYTALLILKTNTMKKKILFVLMAAICCMTGKAQRTLFYESFDKCNGQGGNDLTWDDASVTEITKTVHLDNSSWTILPSTTYHCSQGFMCVRIGEGTKQNGKASTPVFNNMEKKAVLHFRAGGFGQNGKSITVSVKNGYVSGSTHSKDTVVMAPAGRFQDFVIPIERAEGATVSPYIIFDGTNDKSKISFYIDEVKLVDNPENQSTTKVTFGENSDGTIIDDGIIRIKENETFISPKAMLCGHASGNIKYKSSNSHVAVVDNNGNVTLKSLGIAKITAYFNGTEEFASSEMSYIVDYDISKPSIGVSFSSAKGAFKNAHNSSVMQRTTDFIGDDGKAYTFRDSAAFKAIENSDNSPLVMYISKGNITSPVFNYQNGYTVRVTYYAGNHSSPLKIRCGDAEASGREYGVESKSWGPGYTASLDITDSSKPFRITAAYKETYISRIDIIPIPSELCIDEKEAIDIPYLECANVKLTRSLSNTYWNTFCVPFDISAEQVKSVFGNGTVISRFSGMDENNSVMKFTPSDNIEEGVAYLIMPENNVVNPEFQEVVVGVNGGSPVSGIIDGYGFRGVYVPYALQENELFITKRGTLSTAAPGKNIISGMRAFVILPDTELIRTMRLNINGDETSISSLNGYGAVDRPTDCRIYDLNGRQINESKGLRGIYVINGRKVTLK